MSHVRFTRSVLHGLGVVVASILGWCSGVAVNSHFRGAIPITQRAKLQIPTSGRCTTTAQSLSCGVDAVLGQLHVGADKVQAGLICRPC